MEIAVLTAVFGWLTVVNFLVLVLAAGGLLAMRRFAVRTHSEMFSMPEEALPEIYFRWLASYKLVLLAFNLAPYLALRLAA